jgi:hypothetical protein
MRNIAKYRGPKLVVGDMKMTNPAMVMGAGYIMYQKRFSERSLR